MHFPTCKSPQKTEDIKLSSLLEEFSKSKFSGYCKFYFKNEEHIFACKEGAIVLAESEYLKGTQALQAIKNLSNMIGDALICPVSVKQLEVTLLFNSAYRVVASIIEKEAQDVGVNRVPVTKIKPVSIASAVVRKGKVRSITSRTESAETENSKKKELQGTKFGQGGIQLKGRKINQMTLDSLKELKETFKADAADLLKELHMEHLIIQKKRENASIKSKDLKTDK